MILVDLSCRNCSCKRNL